MMAKSYFNVDIDADIFEKHDSDSEDIDVVFDECSEIRENVGAAMELMMVDVVDYAKEPFYVPENVLFHYPELRNRYFVLRHGQSTANVRKVVVSDPKIGIPGFGLTDLGKDQVEKSAMNFLLDKKKRMKQLINVVGEEEAFRILKGDDFSDNNTIVLSSDFRRTMETADLLVRSLGLKKPVNAVKALRERYFGEYDMLEEEAYGKVWSRDRYDYASTDKGVESVASVLARSTALVKLVERMQSGKNVFLVTHGDLGQVLETGFHKMNPSLHRDLTNLKNAEIREMWINPLMQRG